MIPWEFIDSANVPGNSGKLSLFRRGSELSIRVGTCELMNSRIHGSEDALAELACAKLTNSFNPRILIGGLGMGYTLSSALRNLGEKSHIVIAELVPEVVQWNQGPLAHLAGHPLQDKRVSIMETDVARIIQKEQHSFDAILLDVDNGPDALAAKGNEWLYSVKGLDAAIRALRPNGVMAVWSANPDRSFAKRLRHAGFEVEEVRVRARGNKGGGRHIIWVAVHAS